MLVVALATALLAASIAGCGAGSSSSNASAGKTNPSSQSGGQFIAQADAICKRLNSELAAARAKSATAQEVIHVAPHHVALERRALNELGRLAPPSSLSGSWRAILAHRRTLASELALLVVAAKGNDQAAIQKLTVSKKKVHEALQSAATSAGLKDCATVG